MLLMNDLVVFSGKSYNFGFVSEGILDSKQVECLL